MYFVSSMYSHLGPPVQHVSLQMLHCTYSDNGMETHADHERFKGYIGTVYQWFSYIPKVLTYHYVFHVNCKNMLATFRCNIIMHAKHIHTT